MCQRPDWDDLPHTEWRCDSCGFINSCLDPTCQSADCPAGDDCDDGQGPRDDYSSGPAELEGDI